MALPRITTRLLMEFIAAIAVFIAVSMALWRQLGADVDVLVFIAFIISEFLIMIMLVPFYQFMAWAVSHKSEADKMSARRDRPTSRPDGPDSQEKWQR
jgi:hypothetical protein